MSERIPAQISIGGAIKQSLVDDLCGTIRDSELTTEWGDRQFQPTTGQDLLDLAGDDCLTLYDEQAPWGEIPDLEVFLRENDIAYTRRSSAKYEYSAECSEFRPGHPVSSYETTDEGDPIILDSFFPKLIDKINQASQAIDNDQAQLAKEDLRQSLDLIARERPPELPPLEPLSIAD